MTWGPCGPDAVSATFHPTKRHATGPNGAPAFSMGIYFLMVMEHIGRVPRDVSARALIAHHSLNERSSLVGYLPTNHPRTRHLRIRRQQRADQSEEDESTPAVRAAVRDAEPDAKRVVLTRNKQKRALKRGPDWAPELSRLRPRQRGHATTQRYPYLGLALTRSKYIIAQVVLCG
jgi:hypothetical protein